MNILILGGTGAMGKALVQILEKTDDEIYVTSRSDNESKYKNVHYIKGNAHDGNFIHGMLGRRYDAIIDFMIYSVEEFAERVNLFLKSTGQYVFLSSSRVYAASDTAIREDSPRLLDVCKDSEYLRTEEYALAKAREENLLYKSLYRNWTIIRPYITYNDNRLQLTVLEKEQWLYRALQGKTVIAPKELLDKTTTLTYGMDVATVLLSLIGNPNALGETVHITQSESIRWSEILKVYSDVIKKRLGFCPRINTDISIETMGKITGNMYQLKYDRMYNRIFDNSKMQYLLKSDKMFMSTKKGLRECLESFIDNGIRFGDISWRCEGLQDRVTGEYAKMKAIKGVKSKIKYMAYRYYNI